LGRLDLDLLFRVPSVLEFDLAPDGREVAFVWNKTGHYQVHRKELVTGSEVYCSSGAESKAGPRYSPDLRYLAYAQDYQGDEKYDIHLLELGDGTIRNITPDTDFTIYPWIDFSPDARRICLISNRSGKFSAYTLTVEGTDEVLLLDHRFSDTEALWSPDGRYIAVSSLISGQDSGIFICRPDGSESFRLGGEDGGIEASSPAWSPDSRRLAFISSSRGSYDLAIYEVRSGEILWLTDSKHEVYEPWWSPDGKSICYTVNLGDSTVVRIHRIDDGFTDVKVGEGVHRSPRFSRDGEKIYFIFNGPRDPSDIWEYSLVTGEFRRVTHSLPPGLDTSGFRAGREVRYRSSDSREIPALLFIPERPRGRAVVYIHGGPSAQSQNTWNPFIQELLSRGYVVIAPNYRGSTGYGREFREANRFQLGRMDLEDCIAAYRYLVDEGLAQPGKVAVTGGSYGGYLTMCALTKYPGLWACGSALMPFLNWFTEFASEREDLQYWDRENMGDPERDRERFIEASPIFFIDRIQAPVQLIGGRHDPRCPPGEIEQAERELRRLGKAVETVIYEDEGHGFRKLENRVDAYKRICHFISRHLEDQM
jgi:dipeptidyl aminopeptidase/acylaminoacyl peptidase